MEKTSYFCTSCGGPDVQIVKARPSLDDRYLIGHCDKCTPLRLGTHPLDPSATVTPKDRAVVTLIRSDLFNREDFNDRRKTEEARKIVAKVASKGKHLNMSKNEIDKIEESIEWLTRR